ncbi:MAG: insulinase family protein, partial [Alphaproteobacteria bacterium]|nr:insulinase family protein [Alphaproteobacteria bacterium]
TNTHTGSGLFGIYAGLNQEEITNYLPVVVDEIKKITNEFVTDKELNRVKVQMKASILMALESSSSTAEVVARQQLIHNRFIPVSEIVEKIDSITKEDILKAAQYIFNTKLTYTLLGNLNKYPDYETLAKSIR